MADDVELIPVNDQELEKAVFRAWEGGKGPQALSREFALTVTEVEQILDRMLPGSGVFAPWHAPGHHATRSSPSMMP